LDSLQERFDSPSQLGPKFNLTRDGSFRRFARMPGIQNQIIGVLDWLTHGKKVAKRYQL